MVQSGISRRERHRALTRSEAKELALRQLAEAGPSALSLNAIARRMGVTGPALYRYFADRNALLAELVVDAYGDLADAVEAAVDQARSRAPEARFRALAAAYRGWAIAQPHRYRLLFGAPVPGFAAHSERTIAAAQRLMDTLLAILVELNTPLVADDARPGGLDRQLEGWAAKVGAGGVPTPALWRGVLTWSRLHGVISLEIGGNFASMGIDAALLFGAEVDALLSGGAPRT